jgi:Na+-transporting NADH:ubiquinone oxidoreductase subunit A
VLVNERNCGNLSVIPFVFALYSRSFLLLLRQINETIILYKRMANVIKLRKGLDINLKGKASQEFMSVKEPGFYALVPDDFTGITPKVVVKEQEYVMAGGPLFILN